MEERESKKEETHLGINKRKWGKGGTGRGNTGGAAGGGVALLEVVHGGGRRQSSAAQWRRTIYRHEK